jgi:hypothetical protein
LAPWEKQRKTQLQDETTHTRRHQFLTSQLVEETSTSPTENPSPEAAHHNSNGAVELGSIAVNFRSQSRVQNGIPEVINSCRRLPGASSLTSLHDRHSGDLYRRLFMLIRLSKTREEDDHLGIHLVQQTHPTDTNKNSASVRFVISKLDVDSLAARYCLALIFSSLTH